MPAQPGLMRASADDARHLGEHEARAAVRAAAEMDEVVVVGRAVDARVLRHRRHDDAVRQRDAAQRERREHRRRNAGCPGAAPVPLSARPANHDSDPRDERARRAGAGSRARCAGCASAGCRRTARPRTRCSGRRSRTIRWSCAPRSGSSAPRGRARPRRRRAPRRRSPSAPSARASAIASSSASFVPEPTEKCAVCAASPISTTGTSRPSMRSQCVHARQTTRGKRIQIAEPRRCVALEISGWPSR